MEMKEAKTATPRPRMNAPRVFTEPVELGSFVSIGPLENAKHLEPEVLTFLEEVAGLQCVSQPDRDRLLTLVARHK